MSDLGDESRGEKRKRRRQNPDTKLVKSAVFTAEFDHVTPVENVQSILTEGLLTSRAGQEGGLLDVASKPGYGGTLRMNHDPQALRETARGHSYLSKGSVAPQDVMDSLAAGGRTPAMLTAYVPAERFISPTADVVPDPDRTEEKMTHPYTGVAIDTMYRISRDIPPENIMDTGNALSCRESIRPPGQIGADFAPRPAIEAVRSYMSEEFPDRSHSQITEDIRRAQHGGTIYSGSPSSESGSQLSEDEDRRAPRPRHHYPPADGTQRYSPSQPHAGPSRSTPAHPAVAVAGPSVAPHPSMPSTTLPGMPWPYFSQAPHPSAPPAVQWPHPLQGSQFPPASHLPMLEQGTLETQPQANKPKGPGQKSVRGRSRR